MNGFVPFLDARSRTDEEARSALPDSPVQPDHPESELRLRISLAIHRLADRVDPMPASTRPGTPGMAGTGR